MSAGGRTTRGRRTLGIAARQRGRFALAVASVALLLCAVWLALFGLSGPLHTNTVFALPAVSSPPTDTPTNTPTATATATAQPGSIQIVSPSSARGPAGMHVTISGTGFSSGQVAVFASTNQSCSDQPAVLSNVTASNNGFSNAVVDWPASLPAGQYFICAQGVTNPPMFTDMSSNPATIALSSATTTTTTTITVGQTLTITGANFYGVPQVGFSLQNGGVITQLPTLVGNPDANGGFSLQFTPTAAMTGNQTLVASSPAENGAPTSPITVRVSLVIQAGATQTVAVVPTTPSGPTNTSANHSNSSVIIIVIVAVVLIVLAILGIVAFLLLRGRGGPGSGYPGAPGYPGDPGYGETNPRYGAPYGQSSPGMYGGTSGFARPGSMDLPETYAGPAIGGVSQWDEGSDAPDPGWQPRPMSGNRRDDMDDSLYGVYPEATNPYGGRPANSGPGYPPPDPWGDDGYGGPR
ncbi:MAG TPA: hypothetical protein VGR88_04180, partial [Ktedonobacterales bacterium]|nr:hypothetical protein [Ktedonobacterales bacterium]